MFETYIPVLVLFVLAAGFLITMLVLSIVLGPQRFSEVKDDPFECGTIGSGSTSQRHSVRFYLVAMTFIVFDIEIIFMFPWAVRVGEMGWPVFWAMMPFLFIVSVGLIYEWKRGVLDVY